MPTQTDTQDDIVRRPPRQKERVRTHMNLNTKQLAVRNFNNASGIYNKTLMYTDGPVVLRDVEFRIKQATLQKVKNEEARDVCAYAVGKYEGSYEPSGPTYTVRYNPFVCDKFFIPNREGGVATPVVCADELWLWTEHADDGPRGRMEALLASSGSGPLAPAGRCEK